MRVLFSGAVLLAASLLTVRLAAACRLTALPLLSLPLLSLLSLLSLLPLLSLLSLLPLLPLLPLLRLRLLGALPHPIVERRGGGERTIARRRHRLPRQSAVAVKSNVKGYVPGPIGPVNEPFANITIG